MDNRKRNLNLIHPSATPTHAMLVGILNKIEERRQVDPTAYDFLRFFIGPNLENGEARRVRECHELVARYGRPTGGADELNPMRCRSQWCPRCVWADYRLRVAYHCDKLRSLSLEKELRLFHWVVEPPAALHPIVKSRAGLEAFARATWTAISRTFGYSTARTGSRHLGAVLNLHPWGDKGTPWPKWFPHFDACMPALRRVARPGREGLDDKNPAKWTLEPLGTWPATFAATRRHLADALREEFTPLVAAMPFSPAVLDAHHCLEGSITTIFHCSRAGEGDPSRVAKERVAARRISYSTRPLYDPGRVALLRDEHERHVFSYEPQGARVRHNKSPQAAADMLLKLSEFIDGAKVHRHLGTLSRQSYATTARAAGNLPVDGQRRTGRKLKAIYYKGTDGRFDPDTLVRHPERARS